MEIQSKDSFWTAPVVVDFKHLQSNRRDSGQKLSNANFFHLKWGKVMIIQTVETLIFSPEGPEG